MAHREGSPRPVGKGLPEPGTFLCGPGGHEGESAQERKGLLSVEE